MRTQKIVLLDGTGAGDDDLLPVLDILMDELHRSGATIQTFPLRGLTLGSCIGCFGCWIKTPGICVEPDAGRKIAQAIVQSDMTILFTPVTFGGYSSAIKNIQERFIPLALPDFEMYHGEVHHQPRYARHSRLVSIGVQRQSNDAAANLFKLLVGRNALNFHASSYAAEVVVNTATPEHLHQQLHTALVRHDTLPTSQVAKSLLSATTASSKSVAVMDGPGRALLIIGSPKVKTPSNSGILGSYVLEQLQQRGWTTESLTLRGNLLRGEGQTELLAAVDRADLMLLAFPLYIDSLPFLMMKFLEAIAPHLLTHSQERPKRLAAITNNGFPEAHHNAPALAICQQFAADTGMVWLGGLALGAGEVLIGGQPIVGAPQAERPPILHVIQALDIASATLAKGQTIPTEVNQLLAKTPIPLVPFGLWRWLFIRLAHQYWRQEAADNQVSEEALFAQPYAEV
ncbi:MAG: hypothetical protein F6K00_33120 [Leptolyngbya sp. SIOISBB]|nr:hypothetical protein [Leptolyngbya sp. SIOISBB]